MPRTDGAWRIPFLSGEVPDLAAYQLGMRYLLIDEGRLLRSDGLPNRNLAAQIFRLGHYTPSY